MRADEKEFQPFVGKMLARLRHVLRLFGDSPEEFLRLLPHLMAPRGVNDAIARDVQQPRFRFLEVVQDLRAMRVRQVCHGLQLQHNLFVTDKIRRVS